MSLGTIALASEWHDVSGVAAVSKFQSTVAETKVTGAFNTKLHRS